MESVSSVIQTRFSPVKNVPSKDRRARGSGGLVWVHAGHVRYDVAAAARTPEVATAVPGMRQAEGVLGEHVRRLPGMLGWRGGVTAK